ncbi:hypothetical protein FHX48_002432 [Microbacterium halimionae]|uniref:Uncharacterized protein n=1 Tax=Microbacterium halimionae TaxID=1526413 RepID=A0A7W3PML8_9MICO|nr:hypothetical protein [Microbacterium halimionae]NII95967.1 hypothetical protein [Microbacterium halimionae]
MTAGYARGGAWNDDGSDGHVVAPKDDRQVHDIVACCSRGTMRVDNVACHQDLEVRIVRGRDNFDPVFLKCTSKCVACCSIGSVAHAQPYTCMRMPLFLEYWRKRC